MSINEHDLPGIGRRYEALEAGDRLVVVEPRRNLPDVLTLLSG